MKVFIIILYRHFHQGHLIFLQSPPQAPWMLLILQCIIYCPSLTWGLIPSDLLFLCVCLLCEDVFFWVWPITQQHIRTILSVDLSSFVVMHELCVHAVWTSGPTTHEHQWKADCFHVDEKPRLEAPSAAALCLATAAEALHNPVFSFFFQLKQLVIVCELCSLWVGWLWLINFPDVFV